MLECVICVWMCECAIWKIDKHTHEARTHAQTHTDTRADTDTDTHTHTSTHTDRSMEHSMGENWWRRDKYAHKHTHAMAALRTLPEGYSRVMNSALRPHHLCPRQLQYGIQAYASLIATVTKALHNWWCVHTQLGIHHLGMGLRPTSRWY